MLEINNGLSPVLNARVIANDTLVLSPQQNQIRYTDRSGLVIDFLFQDDSNRSPRVLTAKADESFSITLVNFGSSIGMAASGRIRSLSPQEGQLRAGAWSLTYNVSVHLIGDPDKPTRLFSFTLAEERVA